MNNEEIISLRKIIDENKTEDIKKYIPKLIKLKTDLNFLTSDVGLKYFEHPIFKLNNYYAFYGGDGFYYCTSNNKIPIYTETLYGNKNIYGDVIDLSLLHFMLLSLYEENIKLFLNNFEFNIHLKDSVNLYSPLDYAKHREDENLIKLLKFHQKYKDCFSFSNYYDIKLIYKY
jgi:hypothetical protein